MIGTVKFISCPYNYSSRVFPIGDLSEYVVHTAEAKVTKDLAFSFTVPTFEDYHKVNMVQIDDSYYWVVNYVTRTLDNPSTTFTVAYNPVTSLLEENDTLKGIFERVPYTIDPNVSFSVKDDILVKARDAGFDNITLTNGKKVAYVQVTSRREEETDNNSKLTKYVALCNAEEGYQRIKVKANIDGSTNVTAYFPSINDVINDLDDICGLTADSIIDVSISMRSPFTIIAPEPDELAIKRMEQNDFIRPSYKGGIWPGATPERPIVMYSFNRDLLFTERNPPYAVSLTLSEQERHLGYLSLLDEGYNKIAVVPKELCDESGKIEVITEVVSDYTGLYTYVYFGDTRVIIPEGKLPWVGDAWAEYQKRNMEYDRQALELTIKTAKDQRVVDTAENAANSIINGGIAAAINPLASLSAVASFFVSAGADALQEQIDVRSATQELQISQARIKDSPSAFFNTGYGEVYITNSLKSGGARLRLEMPKNTTEAEYAHYVQNYGVPVSGFREVNVQTGFVKGRLTETVFSGARGDLLNTELINGVKMVVL
jgi:hypothetical protein